MSTSIQSVLAVFAGAALLVILTEVQKRRWATGYFTPMTLLIGFGRRAKPGRLDVFAKAAMPAMAGAVTAVIAPSDQAILAALAALAGGLALSWPILLVRDAMPEEMYGRELELRLLHVMYVATATLLGVSGGLLITAVVEWGEQPLLQFGAAVFQAVLVQLIAAMVLFALGVLLEGARMRRSVRLEAGAAQADRDDYDA